jgi:hypothetical protein
LKYIMTAATAALADQAELAVMVEMVPKDSERELTTRWVSLQAAQADRETAAREAMGVEGATGVEVERLGMVARSLSRSWVTLVRVMWS